MVESHPNPIKNTISDSRDIIGIDLGTTNSLVGAVDAGFPILFADVAGSRLTPSAVHYPPSDNPPLVGTAALRMRALAPTRTITSVKRLMGRRNVPRDEAEMFACALAPDSDGLRLRMGEESVSPEQVSAAILKHLRAIAEAALETDVTRAVITVPAYFNDAQRSATSVLANLPVSPSNASSMNLPRRRLPTAWTSSTNGPRSPSMISAAAPLTYPFWN